MLEVCVCVGVGGRGAGVLFEQRAMCFLLFDKLFEDTSLWISSSMKLFVCTANGFEELLLHKSRGLRKAVFGS